MSQNFLKIFSSPSTHVVDHVHIAHRYCFVERPRGSDGVHDDTYELSVSYIAEEAARPRDSFVSMRSSSVGRDRGSVDHRGGSLGGRCTGGGGGRSGCCSETGGG